MDSHSNNSKDPEHEHAHFVLSTKMILKVGATLLALTVITVAVAQINLGHWNFPVAMLVATIKGSLVCLFFMGLKYDKYGKK